MTNYECIKEANINEMTAVIVAVMRSSICEFCIHGECATTGKCTKKDTWQIVKEWLNTEVK
jgi:anthranilate phosphoribosyltransferase